MGQNCPGPISVSEKTPPFSLRDAGSHAERRKKFLLELLAVRTEGVKGSSSRAHEAEPEACIRWEVGFV